MGTLSITRKTSNTLITAAGFNTNYAEIEAVVNGAIEADNIAADAVTAAKINSDVVRSGYGLVQHTDGSLYVDVSDTNPCLEISDGGIRAKVDDSSIERASGGLQVKAGGVTNAMLAGSIVDTNLSQITTASKVSGTALTGLASVPSAAGVIPIANLTAVGLVSVTAGTIAHGETISLPSGFTAGQCYCFVSPNSTRGWSGAGTASDVEISCSVDANRLVTCQSRVYDTNGTAKPWVNGTANYIIIGIK